MIVQLLDYLQSLVFKQNGEDKLVYDVIRRKYVKASPEELVRQLIIAYLLASGYSKKAIQVEKKIKVANQQRRFDAVLFDKDGQPKVVIECKEWNVPISQDTINQAALYNMALSAPYLWISNGYENRLFMIDPQSGNGLIAINQIPQ